MSGPHPAAPHRLPPPCPVCADLPGSPHGTPAPPAATPPVTPLDTALEHVREARRFLGERNRYRQALEEIRDGDAEYAETCRTIARHALGGDHA